MNIFFAKIWFRFFSFFQSIVQFDSINETYKIFRGIFSIVCSVVNLCFLLGICFLPYLIYKSESLYEFFFLSFAYISVAFVAYFLIGLTSAVLSLNESLNVSDRNERTRYELASEFLRMSVFNVKENYALMSVSSKGEKNVLLVEGVGKINIGGVEKVKKIDVRFIEIGNSFEFELGNDIGCFSFKLSDKYDFDYLEIYTRDNTQITNFIKENLPNVYLIVMGKTHYVNGDALVYIKNFEFHYGQIEMPSLSV